MEQFFQAGGKEPFILFSFTHIFTLVLLLLGISMVFLFRKQLRQPEVNRLFRIGLAVVLVLSEVTLHLWLWWADFWDIRFSLPLHLSSISLVFSAVLLLTKHFSVFEFTYFAGLGSALQAMITPDLSAYTFPHFRYIHFFISHGGIVIANLFFVFVERYQPNFRSLLKAFLYLNGYAFVIFMVNLFLNGNYMYISKKPVNPSILDYLGPWPLYLIPLEIVTILTFLLLLSPFAARNAILRRKG